MCPAHFRQPKGKKSSGLFEINMLPPGIIVFALSQTQELISINAKL